MQTNEIIPFTVEMNDLSEYQRLVKPPQSCGMHAGRVVVKEGGDVGEHTTGEYEEMLIILSGCGEARVEDGAHEDGERTFKLDAGTIAYIPPNRRHNIFNTGKGELRYIFTVAPALPKCDRKIS